MAHSSTPDDIVRTARSQECEYIEKMIDDVMFQSALGLAETVDEYQSMMRWLIRTIQERRKKLLQPRQPPLRTSTPSQDGKIA